LSEILLEVAAQPIVITDRAGQIVIANQQLADMFGYAPDELVGRPVEMLLPQASRSAHAQRRTEYFDAPHVRPMGSGMELGARRKNGEEFPVEVALSHAKAADGAFAIAFVTDLSRRKSLEQQIIHSEKMESLGRLAGGVAHDFNNMLTVISGYGAMLKDEMAEHDKHREFIDEILSATRRAASITTQLLAFSRRRKLEPQVHDLNRLIASTELMLRPLLPEHIVLTLILAEDVWKVKAVPDQVEHAIVNLVVNARDAMPEGGRLFVETANVHLEESSVTPGLDVQPGDFAMIAVTDDGVGMDPTVRRQIFEPYFTTKKTGKGTGLGLSTVYGMIRQAGGSISVQSEPGKGTTVRLYFPRADGPVSVESGPEPGSIRPGTETVLVVEDDPSVRQFLMKALTEFGYAAIAAADGLEALRFAQGFRNPIHLLITDVVMPNMNGPQLASELSILRPSTKVLYISGHTGADAVHRRMEESGAPLLPKPFGREDLSAAIRALLDGPAD
jgi:PAS domain S-box-containing protein